MRALRCPSAARGGVPLFRNAYALAANTAITSALGFAFWIAAARLYAPSVVGAGAAAVSLMMLLSTVAQLNLVHGLARVLPAVGSRRRDLVTVSYVATALLAVLVVGAVVVVVEHTHLHVAALPAGGSGDRVWFAGAVVAWTLFAVQDGVLTGLRRATWLPVENAGFGVLKLALLVAFAGALPTDGIFAAWTVPLVVFVVPVTVLVYRRLLRPPPHRPQRGVGDGTTDGAAAAGDDRPLALRAVARFVAGDYVGSLFALASTMLLPPLVIGLLGARANAEFYVAWTIVFALETVALNFATSLTVEGAIDETALARMARAIVRRTAVLFAVVVPTLLVVAPYVLAVYGPAYADGSTTVLRILALGVVGRVVIAPSVAIARVQRRVRRIVAIEAGLGVLIVGCTPPAVSLLGLPGVAVAYAVAHAVVAAALAPSLAAFLRHGDAGPPARRPQAPPPVPAIAGATNRNDG